MAIRNLAIRLAELKALSVAPRVKRGVIIGVDTIVVLDNEIMGKPENWADARRMLMALSGRTHKVISGLCLLVKTGHDSASCPNPQRRLLAAEETRVTFRPLSPAEIEAYLETDEPYDKAGAYGIQGKAGLFVKRLSGDYLNVVGLPVARLLTLLGRL